MFSSMVQPPVLSLFSSSASHPVLGSLFEAIVDPDLQEDSCVCLLDDATSQPAPPPPIALLAQTDREYKPIVHRVLHIQSPNIRKTYLRCPSKDRPEGLGVKLPWLHLQVKNLEREWSFDVGLVDVRGREGRVRCSTFQVSGVRLFCWTASRVNDSSLNDLAVGAYAVWSRSSATAPSIPFPRDEFSHSHDVDDRGHPSATAPRERIVILRNRRRPAHPARVTFHDVLACILRQGVRQLPFATDLVQSRWRAGRSCGGLGAETVYKFKGITI